jgi:UDP-glucuronate 4-epimerase
MPSTIFHFAGQPGVRYSIDNPSSYIESNLVGFFNVLEACRHCKIEHLIYASSSSVYGDGNRVPYSTEDETNHPLSLYAATKKSNELMAHSYSHLYGIPTTGLRFFTVYGPWGRPDMALFKFTKSILEDREITVFNNGHLIRDFTYIDDVVDACIAAMSKLPKLSKVNMESESKSAPWKILNIGSDKPISLSHFISLIEGALNKKAKLQNLPMQSGDVKVTHADIGESMSYLGWTPKVRLEDGIKGFVDWYIDYYQMAQ